MHDVFWRAHRGFVVNINHIREVVPWFKSTYQLRMNDKKQTEIPVSRGTDEAAAGVVQFVTFAALVRAPQHAERLHQKRETSAEARGMSATREALPVNPHRRRPRADSSRDVA